MRTCKESADLITKAEHSRLAAGEWIGLHLHLMICSLCRGHRRNTRILTLALHRLMKGKSALLTLTPAARRRIAAVLQRQDTGISDNERD